MERCSFKPLWSALIVVGLLAGAASAEQDTWQKAKECSQQAEKIVTDKSHGLTGGLFLTWNNHYSPKYDKCYVEIRHMFRPYGDPQAAPAWIGTELDEAFERVLKASIVRDKPTTGGQCIVEGDAVECKKAREFIADHMTN